MKLVLAIVRIDDVPKSGTEFFKARGFILQRFHKFDQRTARAFEQVDEMLRA